MLSSESRESLRAPFPWFGGKSRIASLVWARFGNVPNYVEPFAGSLAVLLGRPHDPKVETVNDVDAYLANFWRALQHEPEHIAYWADWPVNEADLHARHRWLVGEGRERVERLKTEPEFYDCKIAGWWVWGQCLWIGSGWCQSSAIRRDGSQWQQQPGTAKTVSGVHRRWQGGGQGGGSGIHAPTLTRQIPVLRGDAGATGSGIHASARTEGIYDYLTRLALRLRRVRVCCGDWGRVLTPSVTTYMGTTGVFLDPPYSHELRERCYAEDHDISAEVRAWALENGDNPDFRIALCGYADEHGDHMPPSWECVPWKAHGGYSRSERGKENRTQERVWFSPHCIHPADQLQFDQEVG
jgi:D12 class N6 adenine-specific DNA methyltransferase